MSQIDTPICAVGNERRTLCCCDLRLTVGTRIGIDWACRMMMVRDVENCVIVRTVDDGVTGYFHTLTDPKHVRGRYDGCARCRMHIMSLRLYRSTNE